jgi:adenosine deaminase
MVVRSTRELPKSHLHVHADGSFPRPAVVEVARRSGLEVPEPPESFDDTDEFFRRYAHVTELVG